MRPVPDAREWRVRLAEATPDPVSGQRRRGVFRADPRRRGRAT